MMVRIRFILYTTIVFVLSNQTIIGQELENRFYLEFQQPTTETEIYASFLVESGIIEEAVNDLNESFILPAPIGIIFGSGIDGPLYNGAGLIQMPYDFLKYNDEMLAANGFTDDPEEQLETLLDLTEFVLYHEIGHALVHVLDLPVLGKHEDAVDGFAAVISTIWELEDVALAAADVFSIQSMAKSGQDFTDAEFWDSHSLDEQRMFTIFCLIHGSDPQKHSTLLAEVGMPDSQSERCQYDYADTLRNWVRVLGPYIRQ